MSAHELTKTERAEFEEWFASSEHLGKGTLARRAARDGWLAARRSPSGNTEDAARYRWLRKNGYVEVACDSPRGDGWAEGDLDAAIDAAISAAAIGEPTKPEGK